MPLEAPTALQQAIKPNSYVQALIANNMNPAKAYKQLNIQSTLKKDEWEQLDSVVVDEAREMLVGVNDLRTAGLTRTVSIATSIAQYNKMSSTGPAQLAMNALTDADRERVDFILAGVPVPYAWSEFQLDQRTLAASRVLGEGLDVSQAQECGRSVADRWEDMLFNGATLQVADSQGVLQQIFGYLTHPDRVTTAGGGNWTVAAEALADIETMKAGLRNVHSFGPYWLYVSLVEWSSLMAVNANTDKRTITIVQEDGEIAAVKFSQKLPTGTAVLQDPKSRYVQWVQASDIQTVEWDEKGSLGSNFRVLGVGTPLVKSDHAGQSGTYALTGISIV